LPLILTLLLNAAAFDFDLVFKVVILSEANGSAVDSSFELTKRSAALDLPHQTQKESGAPAMTRTWSWLGKEKASPTSR
jgi:hypothetical protein